MTNNAHPTGGQAVPFGCGNSGPITAHASRRFPLRGNRAWQRTVAGRWQDRADRQVSGYSDGLGWAHCKTVG